MLSIPWLVQRGIDLGVPPLLAGQGGEVIYQTVGLMMAAVVVQALCRMFFLRQSGRVGQEVLLELRRRLFRTSSASTSASTIATPPAGSSPG